MSECATTNARKGETERNERERKDFGPTVHVKDQEIDVSDSRSEFGTKMKERFWTDSSSYGLGEREGGFGLTVRATD